MGICGGGRDGVGYEGGISENFQNCVQQIDGCLWGLGGVPMYVRYVHMYVRTFLSKKLDLDPHILTICGTSETGKFVFFINFRD